MTFRKIYWVLGTFTVANIMSTVRIIITDEECVIIVQLLRLFKINEPVGFIKLDVVMIS